MERQNQLVRQTITVLMACALIATLRPGFTAAQEEPACETLTARAGAIVPLDGPILVGKPVTFRVNGNPSDPHWDLGSGVVSASLVSGGIMSVSKEREAAAQERLDIDKLRAEKLARRRIHIMNCDNGHLGKYPDELASGDPVDSKKLLSWRFLGHENTQVDAISLSTTSGGLGRYTHRTEVGEVVQDDVVVRNLLAQGTDHMEIISDWCRENDIEFFWSMRMNDTHDAWGGRNVSELKKRLRDCLLGSNENKPAHGHWTALDYGQEKVRDLVYRIVEEVCTNYEVDGLELDFWRYPVLFRTVAEGSKAGDDEREALTGLIRRIRKTADRITLQKSEVILIAVRVPDSVGYCHDMGIEIETWLKDGLIDILIPGGDFQLNEWESSVKLGHRYGVKVYPSLEVSRLGGTHKDGKSTPQRLMRQSLPGYAARAANVFNAGADGIHSFNLSWKRPSDRKFQMLASRETLRDADKLYFANYLAREGRADFYLPGGEEYIAIERLSPDDPRQLSHSKFETVHLYFGENLDWLEKDDPDIAVHLEVAKIKDPADIVTRLNGKTLDNGDLAEGALHYDVAPSMLRNGLNRFEIRCAGQNSEFVLNDLYISVEHGPRAQEAERQASLSLDKATLSPRLQQVLDAVFPLGPTWRPDRTYDIPGAKALNYVGKMVNVPSSGHKVTRHWVDNKGLVQYGGHFTGDLKIAAANWKGPYDDFLGMKAKSSGLWRIVGARFTYGHDFVAPNKNTPTVSPDQSIELHHCHFDWCNDETVEADAYQPTSFYWCLAERHLNLLSQRNPNRRTGPGTPQGGGEIKHCAIQLDNPPPRSSYGRVLKRDGGQNGVMRISHFFAIQEKLPSGDMFQGRVEIGRHVYGWWASGVRGIPDGVVNLREEGVTYVQAQQLWKALKERWHAMHNLNTWADGATPPPPIE